MPKIEITVQAGQQLEVYHDSFLRTYFDDETIKKLEVQGGSIKIRLVFKRSPKKKHAPKDLSFLAASLKEDSLSREDIEKVLVSLSSVDLTELGKSLDLKLPSKTRKSYLISHILNLLLSKRRWEEIIDSNK